MKPRVLNVTSDLPEIPQKGPKVVDSDILKLFKSRQNRRRSLKVVHLKMSPKVTRHRRRLRTWRGSI